MQIYRLEPHPACPALGVTAVEARVTAHDANWLTLRWRVEAAQDLVLPGFAGKGRAGGLWQTTCFELFLRPDGDTAYHEFNLSSSERWNAYRFSAPRDGMSEWPMPRDAVCTMRPGGKFAIFDAALPAAGLPQTECAMGISCVIEETGGYKSYWALAHGREAPDFHDPSCFTARLGAASAP